jgi:hypothetical protein
MDRIENEKNTGVEHTLPSNGMGKKGDLISVKNDTPHEQKQTSA